MAQHLAKRDRQSARRTAGLAAFLAGATLVAAAWSSGGPASADTGAARQAPCTSSDTAGRAAGNGARLDVLSTYAQVLPRAPRNGAGAVQLCAARNSFASFQLSVTARAGALSGVSMAASALTGPGGAVISANATRLYREGYSTLRSATDAELPEAVRRGASGDCLGDCRFPDALIPDVDTLFNEKRKAFPFAVPAGENRVVWADVLVPRNAAAGTYRGTVTVRQAGGASTKVPVTITVEGVALPSTSSVHSTFFMSIGGGRVTSAADFASYAELGLENRINIVPNSPGFGDLTTYLRPLLAGTDPKVRLPGAQLTDFSIHPGGWNADFLRAYKDLFTSLGQTGKVTAYCDEATPADCADSYTSSAIPSVWKGLPLLAIDDPLVGWADPNSQVVPAALQPYAKAVVPLVQFLDPIRGYNPYTTTGNRMPAFASWRSGAAGRQVWAYTSCMSGGCDSAYDPNPVYSGWPSYGTDQVATEQAAMGWQLFGYGLDGEVYYETLEQPELGGDPMFAGMNGDGTLFYHWSSSLVGGTHPVPVETIRLKRIRDGRQDYELLKLARAKGADAVGLARATFPSMSASAPSAATLDRAHAKLLMMFGAGTPARMDAHDLDCDGHNDLTAVRASSGDLVLYRRTATDWVSDTPVTLAPGGRAYERLLLAGDLDRDGAPDLLGRRADGSLWLLAGDCGTHLAAPVATGSTTVDPTAVGDFNGDGLPDLQDKHADGTLWLLAGNGRGGFDAPVHDGNGWSALRLAGVGDVDGDGAVDVYARTDDGRSLLYAGDGQGGWQTEAGRPLELVLPVIDDPQVLCMGDLTGDGHPDLLAVEAGGRLVQYAGTGSGFFTTGVVIGNGWVPGNIALVAH